MFCLFSAGKLIVFRLCCLIVFRLFSDCFSFFPECRAHRFSQGFVRSVCCVRMLLVVLSVGSLHVLSRAPESCRERPRSGNVRSSGHFHLSLTARADNSEHWNCSPERSNGDSRWRIALNFWQSFQKNTSSINL